MNLPFNTDSQLISGKLVSFQSSCSQLGSVTTKGKIWVNPELPLHRQLDMYLRLKLYWWCNYAWQDWGKK